MTAPLPNLDELEGKARAATPGPWDWEGAETECGTRYQHVRSGPEGVFDTYHSDALEINAGVGHPMTGTVPPRHGNAADAIFAAAASPDVVLSLVAEIRRLQVELSGYKDSRVEWNGSAEVPTAGGLALQDWKSLNGTLPPETPVRIFSGEHHLWWKPDGHGYTALLREAGIFNFASALERSSHCGPEKRIVYYPVEAP